MFNFRTSSAPPKMDVVQIRRNQMLLYDMFPNVDRPVIDAVFEQCNNDMERTSETLLTMSPPTDPRRTYPTNQNWANWNSPQMHNPTRPHVKPQMPANRMQLPNEYVHKFEMKQGDSSSSTSNKATRYDQIYVNQPYMMRTSEYLEGDKDVIAQNSDLSLPNIVPVPGEAKGSAIVEELRKEVEENKQMMSKLMNYIQNQNRLQVKEIEDATAKIEAKVVPPTEEEVELQNQIKKKSDLKKLLMLQQDINKKMEENKESVINMLDNFKLEMQNMFTDKIKALTEDDKYEENEETARAVVENPPLIDDEKPGCSSSQSDNETKYPFTQKSDIEEIMPIIREGCKVLLLMRGLPGSGKTTLASSILYRSVGKVDRDKFIYSTNDYMKKTGFPIGEDADENMKQALLRNQRRCYEAMKVGVSPIIIDDNNLEIHEMRLYCTLATMFGYIIEIVEPQTPWALTPETLAQRNTTGMDEMEIQEMLKRFQQNITVNDLREEFKLSYKEDIPQFRKYPPIPKSK